MGVADAKWLTMAAGFKASKTPRVAREFAVPLRDASQWKKMTSELGLQLYTEMLKAGCFICAPLLGITLLVGLLTSVLQVVTQVQDSTLAFVPKLAAFVIAATVMAPWMLHRLQAFATTVLSQAAMLR